MEINKILIIIRRSNGDVFLSTPLIEGLKKRYPYATIDLLVNKDTEAIAKTLPFINKIHLFDYEWKKEGIFKYLKYELKLIYSIYKKYDLSINLTANDHSVFYTYLAGRKKISVIDKKNYKSWWKKLLLNHTFFYSKQKHIVEQVTLPLELLGIKKYEKKVNIYIDKNLINNIKLPFNPNKPFIIFHPSAQYNYKIYPTHLRNKLLEMLNTLNIPIIITGGKSEIDLGISNSLPKLKNIYNLIGKTSLSEYIALNDKALAYIGMDTLNMHIAAALNKQVFAIFGPTLPQIWSPWCNSLEQGTKNNVPIQKYGNITIFQADMPCVACGKAGCDDKHGKSECLYAISPETIFNEVKKWLSKLA